MSNMEEIRNLNGVESVSLGTPKIAISDQDETSLGEAGISDSFIVDIEKISHGTIEDSNISASSRISVKLQRNLSRKGSRERSKATLASAGASDASSNGGSDPEKSPLAPTVSSGSKDPINKQPQHTIIITAENSTSRKCLKHRSSFFGPRRVLLLFATLSSMGTILLIYFTLSMGKLSADNSSQAQ